MVQDKTAIFYINKRIDALEQELKEDNRELKDNDKEIKTLISEHLNGCQEEMEGHNCRLRDVEHFKIRVYQSVSLIVGALGIYKVFF